MTYRIDFSSKAKAGADAAFLSFFQFTTADRAQLRYQGLIKAIVSLHLDVLDEDLESAVSTLTF